MSVDQVLVALATVSSPPPGIVNVRVGKAVEGPGGRWVPCASAIEDGAFLPCVFEVGPGRRQVSGSRAPLASEEEAFSRAMELALTAAS